MIHFMFDKLFFVMIVTNYYNYDSYIFFLHLVIKWHIILDAGRKSLENLIHLLVYFPSFFTKIITIIYKLIKLNQLLFLKIIMTFRYTFYIFII